MNLLLASSEVHPFSKTGGLADMVGAMGKTLARMGHRVGIVTPLYRGIERKGSPLSQTELTLEIELAQSRLPAAVWELEALPGLTVYFLDQPLFYDREGLYQEDGSDYPDNAARFVFFSKGVFELARRLSWKPDLVHAHDWQAGLVPLLLRHARERAGWEDAPPSCFTIHNLAYQGTYDGGSFALTNLPGSYFTPDGLEFYGKMNCLKAGIQFADVITTVSPRYSREVMTPEYGCGLDGCLRAKQERFCGILNGVDYDEWNTENNPHLSHPYSIDDLSGKEKEKLRLQTELGLTVDSAIPLFGSVTRLTDQKGIDIMIPALEEMLRGEMQTVMLGSGDHGYQTRLRKLSEEFPKKFALRSGMHPALAHRIEAASDFYLMPSAYEPCGLNQLYSLRYGTVPIVRATGGLDDTIIDIRENAEKANGIKFNEYSAQALTHAMAKALELHKYPDLLAHYRYNGMTSDFSWERTAGEYLARYEEALKRTG